MHASSNRSACHLSLRDADKALADADACVALRSDWAKGHFRRGAALELCEKDDQVSLVSPSSHRCFDPIHRLDRFRPPRNESQALQAYQRALELDRKNSEVKETVKRLKLKIAATAERQQRQQRQPQQRRPGHDAGQPGGESRGRSLPSPDGWAVGLSLSQKYGWLVDCYRMRLDDDCVYRGAMGGLYSDGGKVRDVAGASTRPLSFDGPLLRFSTLYLLLCRPILCCRNRF